MNVAVVDIWKIDLSGVTLAEDQVNLLSNAERTRAERFRFDAERLRYIASHVAVRCILAKYADRNAGCLQFREGANGKPELAESSLQHNLAHSGDLALLAVSAGEPVGIDLEKRRWVPDAMDIAERMFSHRECQIIGAAAKPHRSDLFLRCWTAKEGVLKTTGKGLSGAPKSFDVSAVLHGGEALGPWPDDSDRVWVVRGLDLGADYFGAVGRGGNLGRIEFHSWE